MLFTLFETAHTIMINYILRHKLRILLSFLIVATFLANTVGSLHLPIIDRLENDAYAARLNFTMPNTVDPRIVIVDIDEKSLAVEGRWPWNRARVADMVNVLFDKYQIAALGFDVVFAEPDNTTGLPLLNELSDSLKHIPGFATTSQQLRQRFNTDAKLAAALANRPTVLGYYFKSEVDGQPNAGKLATPAFAIEDIFGQPIYAPTGKGFGANLPELVDSSFAQGHFNPTVDADGIVRRVAMYFNHKGSLYESLSLALVRAYLEENGTELVFEQGLGANIEEEDGKSLEIIRLGTKGIPVDDHVQALVPYRGKAKSFPYVSATDILNGTVDPGIMFGTIVLVGTTAPGLLDLRATPVSPVYPGVEIHANLVAGILDNLIKERPSWAMGGEFTVILLTGVLLTFLLTSLSAVTATFFTLVVAGILTAFNLYLWDIGLVLPIAATLTLIVSLFMFNMAYGFFVEGRHKREISKLFGQYVPPELVEEMSNDPSSANMEGDSLELTVLFSDVRAFTNLSEGLDPKELTKLMNAYLTPMTHVIHKRRGTIDKYMGDAIMAFWGAPVRDVNHAHNAMLAALDMVTSLEQVNKDFALRGWKPIAIGIGLNTGIMTVGNMGSEFRMSYTVMGDSVNLGSRLEGLSKNYGVMIVVSEFTLAAAPAFAYRELDRVRVKGKLEPVRIYEPVGLLSELSDTEQLLISAWEAALVLYHAQQWQETIDACHALQAQDPDRKLYDIYIERAQAYLENPPSADWDGVYTFTTK